MTYQRDAEQEWKCDNECEASIIAIEDDLLHEDFGTVTAVDWM
jgi:hypothetical protein